MKNKNNQKHCSTKSPQLIVSIINTFLNYAVEAGKKEKKSIFHYQSALGVRTLNQEHYTFYDHRVNHPMTEAKKKALKGIMLWWFYDNIPAADG